MLRRVLLILLALTGQAHATNFYISPTGNNANDGLTASTPFLTFTYALDASRASCGDTLILRNGTYGSGTSTGRLYLSGRTCTAGNELVIQAENQRQAKILDNGSSRAVEIIDSAYITIDGLYARSSDNSGSATGTPFFTNRNTNITLKNLVGRNPNRYANVHVFAIENSSDVLIEDAEAYVFHRHCVEMWQSSRVTARRVYCNPRGGKIPGGFGLNQGPLGSGASAVSMYPCRDCIQENVIADGTTNPMFLNEMNATYGASILMSGSQVLGSICYKCNVGNGIYINSRSVADLNHTPQNITVRNVVFLNQDTYGYAIRVSDGVGIVIDRITGYSDPSTGTVQNGITTDDNAGIGTTSASNTLTMTNIQMAGYVNYGFRIVGFNTWTGNYVNAYNNGTSYSPALPANWTNAGTANLGTAVCPWIPDGNAAKGAGSGGGDLGANVLYRYVNGVLTNTPLWDPATGAFPHGADDLDGTNNVAGQSLKDFHTRVNVNSGSCLFPAGYGGGGGGGSAPTNPANVIRTTDLTGPHVHIVDATANKSLTVAVAVRHDGLAASYATGITNSCGGAALAQLSSPAYTPAVDRSLVLFGVVGPASGTCTLTPTFSGANVSGWVMISRDDNGVGSYGAVASASALSSTPNITVVTNTDHTVLDFLATSHVPTLSSGSDQVLTTDLAHATKFLRGAASVQAGSAGGSMTHTIGGNYGWILQGLSLIPPSSDPPSTAVLTQTHYQVFYALGSEVGAIPMAELDAPADIAGNGMFRMQASIHGSVASTSPFSVVPTCRVGADAFTRVLDVYSGKKFRLIGNGPEGQPSGVPASLSPVTRRLNDDAGNYVGGAVLNDQSSVWVVPTLSVNQYTELSSTIVVDGAEDDVIQCRYERDNGDLLIYADGKTATINVRSHLASTP